MRPGDLTRWNRAGLSRFRYVDGNAVTYLERLREALAEAYDPEATGLPRWLELVTRHPIAPDEDAVERQGRLAAQYEDARRDYGWEILRAFARSTHVLTEHLDAYANETFIGTATQWDSLRKLVAMLDARPGPPASARTDLAFEAKAAGTLAAGFKVKNAPSDGGAPAIFETAEDLTVDPALNAVRPRDWDRSQIEFEYTGTPEGHFARFPKAAADAPPTVGEMGVLLIAPESGGGVPAGYAVQVVEMLDGIAALIGEPTSDGADLSVAQWRISLLLGAERVQTPRLAGPDVVVLTSDHNLVAGRSSITWEDDKKWLSAKVLEVDGDRVRLSGSSYPPKDAEVFLLARTDAQVIGGSRRVVLPEKRGGGSSVWSLGLTQAVTIEKEEAERDDGEKFIVYQYVPGLDAALYAPADADPVAEVLEAAPDRLIFAGAIDDIAQGDWIVSAGEELQAARVDSVMERAGDTELEITPALKNFRAPVHAVFSRTLFPLDHDRNMHPIFDEATRSDQATRLIVAPAGWPDAWPKALAAGRRVVIADDTVAHSAVVKAVDAVAGTLDIAPPIPGTELTEPEPDAHPMVRWNTTIYANVATADHGETQPRKILGSGDATRSGQSFELQARELSFVPDPLMPTGVRAAVEVYVGDRRWAQVANLRDSGMTDAHYEVRVTEDGPVVIRFGDGRDGRRLPTGTDNVRAVWRKGVGEAGNLPAGSLIKIVKPDPLIAAVRQPLAAAGGAETETVTSLRRNAAAGLLTLGRAVSVPDFAKLATQHASVLQAHAYRSTAGAARTEAVTVVIVPAGGRIASITDEVQTFLQRNGLPGIGVTIAEYTPLPLGLDVTIRVRSAEYVPEQVADGVKAGLIAAYDLKAARLAAPLFRSHVLHLIEQIEGVENTAVEILTAGFADVTPAPRIGRSRTGGVHSVRPAPNQMIHYVPERSTITVRTEEFSL